MAWIKRKTMGVWVDHSTKPKKPKSVTSKVRQYTIPLSNFFQVLDAVKGKTNFGPLSWESLLKPFE